jgi:hypothetical protein
MSIIKIKIKTLIAEDLGTIETKTIKNKPISIIANKTMNSHITEEEPIEATEEEELEEEIEAEEEAEITSIAMISLKHTFLLNL